VTMLARIPADVPKRLALSILALALVGASCGEPPAGEVDLGSGRQFVPQIADSIDDVGFGAAIALDGDGVPFISYFGFPAKLAAGEIPIGRPVGAPFVPGVLIASQQKGIWNRGAAAMYRDPPALVSVPFGPATVESLSTATAGNTNGTDIAVDTSGGMHVVWTGPDGIWYASGSDSFTAEKIVTRLPPLSQAGPLGWPAVAVDGDGTPWVAATVTASDGGQEVVVATPRNGGWDVQTVATLTSCKGCPQPERTGVAVGPGGPVVVYADPAEDSVMAARLHGRSWTSERVEAGVDATGISVAVGKDGTTFAAYYAGKGTVSLATSDGEGWAATDAATIGSGTVDGESTGVAVADDGTAYLTYVDPGTGAVVLASASDGGGFEPIATRGTEGGRWPAVDVTPDGATVSLVWYDPEGEDLAFGTIADSTGLVLAAPSPTFVPASGAPGGGAECTADATPPTPDVTVIAPPGAIDSGFDQTCVVVPAAQKVSITFDNQDPGQSHNLSGYTDPSAAEQLFTSGLPAAGPETQGPASFGPFDAGTYYFHCDVHPATMNGTFLVAKAKKKK
jgi:plastocyanin